MPSWNALRIALQTACMGLLAGGAVLFAGALTVGAAFAGRLLVGASAGKLFALSRTHLVCVELEGGLVRWMRKLPAWSGPRHSGRPERR